MISPEQNHQNTKICPKCGKEYPKKTIMCEDCNITLMKRTTYGRLTNDCSSMLLICPNCKKRFYPPINTEICDICNSSLITNDEYVQKQHNFNEKFNTILVLIFLIGAIALIWFIGSIISSPSSDNTYICERCGKTFTDIENTKSIAYSNFCLKCRDDVEFMIEASEALEEQ